MADIEFPIDDSIKDKNIQKILFLPESNKIFIWIDNKPIQVDVDLKNPAKTEENYHNAIAEKIDNNTEANLLLIISHGLEPYYYESADTGEEKKRNTEVRLAFETVKEQAKNLFIDEYKIPHIALPIEGHSEVLPIDSKAFKNWYRMFIFERDGVILKEQTIHDLVSLACAYAASPKYGTEIPLNLRTALNGNFGRPEWIYDLTNKNWEFVRISSNGWDLFTDQVIFRHYNNQQPQAYPDRDYNPRIFDEFFKLVNIKPDDEDSILLLKCYIISLFIPEIQKVILMLHGSQGAAKSSLQELIKILVDPSIVKTFTFPRDLNELQQQLSHNYLVYYDNISIIRPWISDELCRAVSGSGSSKRQLYTDDDDIIRRFKRGVGMNGINLAATKADLLDRSIIIKLERILDGKQRTPEDIWKAFDGIRAQLFGYILDILVKVLEYEEQNPDEQFKLTRMTEFAKYGEIISRCMGYPNNAFIEAYERNRQIQTEEIIEFSQVATVITYMMFDKYDNQNEWDGTASGLLGEFKSIIETDENRDIPQLNIDVKNEYWPKNGNALRRRLNELIPTLKQIGLEFTFYKATDRNKTRRITIRKVASDPSDASEEANSCSNMDDFSDANADANPNGSDDSETIASEDISKNRAQNNVSDAKDATDANVRSTVYDVSKFIKLDGYVRGDKITYFLDHAVADLSVQNNFIGGQFKMKGVNGGRYPIPMLRAIDEIFGFEKNIIEVCSNQIEGLNKGGNCYTVDINPEYEPDLIADGQDLAAIPDNSYNRWRCDPPYNRKTAKEMYNCKLPNVTKLLKEGCRVVKPNSLLFLLHEDITPSNIAGLRKIGFIHVTAIPNKKARALNIYMKVPTEKSK
jgi:hypothetical protein